MKTNSKYALALALVIVFSILSGGQQGWGPPITRPIPDTGIDLCYDETQEIDCPSTGEPFYGQDAQVTTNPLDFEDNGDGTVSDSVTGLLWQREDDDTTRTWWEAKSY